MNNLNNSRRAAVRGLHKILRHWLQSKKSVNLCLKIFYIIDIANTIDKNNLILGLSYIPTIKLNMAYLGHVGKKSRFCIQCQLTDYICTYKCFSQHKTM